MCSFVYMDPTPLLLEKVFAEVQAFSCTRVTRMRAAGQNLRVTICGPTFAGQNLRATFLRAKICGSIFAGQNLQVNICGPTFAGRKMKLSELLWKHSQIWIHLTSIIQSYQMKNTRLNF